MKINVGCGNRPIAGFMNVDIRPTDAADLVADCSDVLGFVQKGSASAIFGYAFLEHLTDSKAVGFVGSCYQALGACGRLVLAGIPNFKHVAALYLGGMMPLQNVFLATHGLAKKHMRYSDQQLHKALYDATKLRNLMEIQPWFKVEVFEHGYPTDVEPISLGVIAWKGKQDARFGLADFGHDEVIVNPEVVQC